MLMLVGIAIGLCVGIGGMFMSSKLYKDILILKAGKGNRTPEKLGDKYYYIVPDNEYIEMEKYSLFWKYQNEINKGEKYDK